MEFPCLQEYTLGRAIVEQLTVHPLDVCLLLEHDGHETGWPHLQGLVDEVLLGDKSTWELCGNAAGATLAK